LEVTTRTVSVTTTSTTAAGTASTDSAIPRVNLYQYIHYLLARRWAEQSVVDTATMMSSYLHASTTETAGATRTLRGTKSREPAIVSADIMTQACNFAYTIPPLARTSKKIVNVTPGKTPTIR